LAAEPYGIETLLNDYARVLGKLISESKQLQELEWFLLESRHRIEAIDGTRLEQPWTPVEASTVEAPPDQAVTVTCHLHLVEISM